MSRLYLSPPHMSGRELELIREAFESNWIAPVGPHVDAFERELAAAVDVPHAAALSSGTAALHLALRLCGVGPGDSVLVPSLTFIASVSPVEQLGAEPVFLDVDADTWTIDPGMVSEELDRRARAGRLPRAVVTVDLYGQSADHEPILAACEHHGVAVIEDAAEALGASYRGRPVGDFGRFGVFSFNGNKILTTSGGGALVSRDGDAIGQARFLATQARDPAPHYQHSTLGYNYRLSNVLAAIGRGQLEVLEERVTARRRNFELYAERLADLPGVGFMPEAPYGRANRWLTVITFDPAEAVTTPDAVRQELEADDIEARPVWKPLHLQPVFAGRQVVGGAVSERLFATGLCLPSGSSLTEADVDRVAAIVRRAASR